MQLSIIIVNYNVKYFLEQCLCSVEKAITQLKAEVIVVDNVSVDGSYDYLIGRFPWVKWIQNNQNAGFGKANNQGVAAATGTYICYLNPDTIVPEDCFVKALQQMEVDSNIGALGVKMIDGSGRFLPESKRAFPSLKASFFKLGGLAALFPKSPVFNKYALGHLNENESHQVEVLAGAFMILPKMVAEKLNGFDEAFFMYGEDIDLSYRVHKLGLKNIYFAQTSILHFKGESTNKGLLNYTAMFYEAMLVFVKKHYAAKWLSLAYITIQIAVICRALIGITISVAKKLLLPMVDAAIIIFSWHIDDYLGISKVFNRYNHPFNPSFGILIVGMYWLLAMMLGLYHGNKKMVSFILVGIPIVMVGAILNSITWVGIGIISIAIIYFFRQIAYRLGIIPKAFEEKTEVLLVGSTMSLQHANTFFNQAQINSQLYHFNCTQEPLVHWSSYAKKMAINEVVFCIGQALTYQKAIEQIEIANSRGFHFKIMGYQSQSIVGSYSKTSCGEVLTSEGNFAIEQPYQQSMRRLAEIVAVVCLILVWPIALIIYRKRFVGFASFTKILTGKAMLIGYEGVPANLPNIPPGLLTVKVLKQGFINFSNDTEHFTITNYHFAKHFSWWKYSKAIILHFFRFYTC